MIKELWDDIKKELKYKNDGTFIRVRDNKILNGYETGKGYKQIVFKYVRYSYHRFVFFYHFGYFPKFIDHINGNKKDNRITNLRECSIFGNAQNTKIVSFNTSGVKGLSFDKARNKWRASIQAERTRHFKRFNTKKEAIQWIKETRKELHGNFARN